MESRQVVFLCWMQDLNYTISQEICTRSCCALLCRGYTIVHNEFVRLPQCQWSKPDGYKKISQCITTTMHSKAKTVCIFLGIYCSVSGTESPAHWIPADKTTELSRIKLQTWTQEPVLIISENAAQSTSKRFTNRKETSQLPLLNAVFESGSL